MSTVVIIAPAHPLRGGLATFNERMARAFQAAGHRVIIYTFSLQYPNFLFPGKTQYTDDPKPKDLDIRVKVNSVNPFNWRKIGREVKKLAPDLVIFRYWLPFMGPCFGTIGRIIRKNRKTKIVAIADNVIPHEKRPGDRIFTRYFLKCCDGFITMSRAVLNDLAGFNKDKPRMFTPHPLYDNFGDRIPRAEAKSALGLDPATRYLLFFGFIRTYKGLDWLLEAFADDRLRKHPLKLIIAGEYYADSKPYKDLIAQYQLAPHVIQANDFIPNDEVAKYFCASELVVQPYKTATQSGVTQIAYHFQIPMIVTNVSGLPENVPDGVVGYVVEQSPKAVADGILKFFKEEKGAEFSENMVAEKAKYSWEILVGNILKVAGLD